jgi:uncharacterized membrane protein
MTLLLALVAGAIAGLRTMMAPAALSWAAYFQWLPLHGTWLAFLGFQFTPWVLTLLALVELVTDQLPTTPSRKVPVQFAARIVSGALSGGAIGLAHGAFGIGLAAGVLGAVAGTFAGHAARARLAAVFGSDRPAALLEDAVAIALAVLVTSSLG